MSLETFDLHLPRNAFSPRDAARAGDIWRLLQDAAVLGSSRRGWTPERYREEGAAFVVRRMSVVHHREVAFGEPLTVLTWVSSFRRGMLSDRQIRVASRGDPAVSASQDWVHVAMPDMKPKRASDALIAA